MPLDDNVQVGLGDTGGAMIATEFWGGADGGPKKHFQIVKLAHGDHNEVALVEDGAGTGGRPLPVRLFVNDTGTGLDSRVIGSTTALEMNILGSVGATAIGVEIKNTGDVQGITGTITITSGSGLAYWGLTGGDTITIRGLSAGPTSGVAPSSSYDYVSVQGTTQGFPVRSTLWAQHGRTAVGISGDGTLKTYVTNTVGVTIDSGGMGITTHAGALKVIQGVSAGGGGWGITTNGKRIDVKTRTGNYLGIRGLSAGSTISALSSGKTHDSVAIQGMTQGFPVRSALWTQDGATAFGCSGDALKVAIVSAGITVNVDVTDTSFMVGGNSAGGKYVGHAVRVVGKSGGNVLSTVVGSLTAGDPAVRVVGPSGAALIVAGSPGATAIGVTLGVPVYVKTGTREFGIRGLTAGPTSGAYNSLFDYVSVQGRTQGYPVRSAIWSNEDTAGKRKAVGVSGAAGSTSASLLVAITNNSLTVDGNTMGVTGTISITSGSGLSYYGITGGDTITIRGLSAGPSSGVLPSAAGASYDYVNIQGTTQGYPVRSALWTQDGVTAFGCSGDALKVAIDSAGITINVDVTDTTFMMQGLTQGGIYSGHAIRVVGASGGSIAVHPAGNTLTGITIGVPVFVKSENLDIRGLTFASGKQDHVGVSGAAYNELVSHGQKLASIGATLDAMYPVNDAFGLARQQTADNIWTNIDANITAPLATNATVSIIAKGISGGGSGVNTAESVVRVVHTDQPVTVVNGQQGVGTSAVQMSSSTTILKSGVNIKSHQQNSGKIYIGGDSNVTTNTSNGGYPLSAGEEMFIECKSPNMIYVIGDATGLTACFISS
jgi:hypothetical protein